MNTDLDLAPYLRNPIAQLNLMADEDVLALVSAPPDVSVSLAIAPPWYCIGAVLVVVNWLASENGGWFINLGLLLGMLASASLVLGGLWLLICWVAQMGAA